MYWHLYAILSGPPYTVADASGQQPILHSCYQLSGCLHCYDGYLYYHYSEHYC